MRTTIDIADEQYAQLKARAAIQRTTVKALIADAVGQILTPELRSARRAVRSLPTIGSKASKPLNLSHEKVNELLLDLP